MIRLKSNENSSILCQTSTAGSSQSADVWPVQPAIYISCNLAVAYAISPFGSDVCLFAHVCTHVCALRNPLSEEFIGRRAPPRHQPRRAMPTVQKKTKARAVKRLLALGVTLRQVEPAVEACQEMLDVDADTLTKDFCGNVLADNDIAVVTRSLGSLDGTFCTITFQDAGDALRSHIKQDVEAERMFRDRMRACPT